MGKNYDSGLNYVSLLNNNLIIPKEIRIFVYKY
jgi:hypothetical protein